MNRVSNTPVTRRRRKKVLKQAKGYFGSKHKLFKTAKEQVMRSLSYAYADKYGIRYSQFIRLLTLAQVKINRKQLSEMAIHQPQHFDILVNKVQNP
ncbi:6291_t:CDS:2 [Funneliformis geosporum]|uniref:6291_t:CDS:1 n=1 Tax=Funneliformis geosporum TaxID=1117311 RepID=A0A9W4SQP8_9GLOM|nr:6291_t:CDS:2 [Funneliformis geosporum]